MILTMMGLYFLHKKKNLAILKKNNICINVFGYENRLTFQFTFQKKNLKVHRFDACI